MKTFGIKIRRRLLTSTEFSSNCLQGAGTARGYKMLDEQGTRESFLTRIRAEERAGKLEKQELELSSVKEDHREHKRKHFQMGKGKDPLEREKEARSFGSIGEASLTLSAMSGELSDYLYQCTAHLEGSADL